MRRHVLGCIQGYVGCGVGIVCVLAEYRKPSHNMTARLTTWDSDFSQYGNARSTIVF